jgi:hypothetical protein
MRSRIDEITQTCLPPEYFVAERVRRQAQQLSATMSPPPAVAAADPFDAGEVSEDWIEQTIQRESDHALCERRRAVLLTLLNSARARGKSLHQNAVPRILRALDNELQNLLRDAELISDQLGDADTAQKAIASDAGPLWKRLTELSDDYAELRRVQHNLMPPEVVFNAKAAFGEDHASDLYLKNLDTVMGTNWRNPAQTNDRVIHIDGSEHRYEPWPLDLTELLLWLVRSEAQAWIPTENQLQRLREDRIARANPMPTVVQGRPDLETALPAAAKGTPA